MNFLQGKYRLVAWLVAAFTAVGSLQAAPTACQPGSQEAAAQHLQEKGASLEQARAHLKELSKDIKDKKLMALMKDAYKKAGRVVKQGKKADPDKARKALDAVQKVVGVIKQKKAKKEHLQQSPQEFSSSCSVCSELSELESEVEECCEEILRRLSEIINFLETQFPCTPPIKIDHVPIIINQSGKYCVTQDLITSISNPTGMNPPPAAITVTAPNVTINFAGHSLTVTNNGVDGIQVTGNEFVLENDVIMGPANPTSTTLGAAVHLIGVQKATINNIYAKNFWDGIQIEASAALTPVPSQDIIIKNSFVQANRNAGVYIDNSRSVTIETTTFDGANLNINGTGLWIANGAMKVIVEDSTFNGWDFSIFAGTGVVGTATVSGIKIDDCLVVGANDLGFNNLAQFGDIFTRADDVIIANSTFNLLTATSPQVPTAGLLFANGFGLHLENVIVHTAVDSGIQIGLGLPGIIYEDIVAKGVNVLSRNKIGLNIVNGIDILFDNCLFSDATINNVRITLPSESVVIQNSVMSLDIEGAISVLISGGPVGGQLGGPFVTIRNCEVTLNGGAGIFMDATSSFNTVIGNVINGNLTASGIEDRGTSNGIFNNEVTDAGIQTMAGGGIFLNGSTESQVNGNTTYGNFFGIANGGTNSSILFNASCNNVDFDCLGVFPAQLPGDPALAGSNVCCTSDVDFANPCCCTSAFTSNAGFPAACPSDF